MASTTEVESPARPVVLDVHPLTGTIGAEIRGVDVSRPLDRSTVAAIRRTLLEWKVVFFRGQSLDPASHVAFGRNFGEVTPAHPTLKPAIPEHPEVLVLQPVMDPDDDEPLRFEHRWHTDVTFAPNPPTASILRAVVVPPYGGDTQWLDLQAAYEELSPRVRTLVDGLHAVHQNRVNIARGEVTGAASARFASQDLRASHPMVRVHPESGRRGLFVNPAWTTHVEELSRQEGRHLLAMLYEHMADARYTCRFRWEPGSVAFWDNRATCHRAPSDVPEGLDRRMERITLAGEPPVGPDGSSSRAIAGDPFT